MKRIDLRGEDANALGIRIVNDNFLYALAVTFWNEDNMLGLVRMMNSRFKFDRYQFLEMIKELEDTYLRV